MALSLNRYFWYHLFSVKTVFSKNAKVKEGAHVDEIRLDATVLSNYLLYFVRGREMIKFYKKSFSRQLKNSRISTKTQAKRRTHEFCFLCTTLETQSSQSKGKCSHKNMSVSIGYVHTKTIVNANNSKRIFLSPSTRRRSSFS